MKVQLSRKEILENFFTTVIALHSHYGNKESFSNMIKEQIFETIKLIEKYCVEKNEPTLKQLEIIAEYLNEQGRTSMAAVIEELITEFLHEEKTNE